MYNSTKKRNVIKHLYAMTRFTFLVLVTMMTLAGVSLAREVKSQGMNEVKVTVSFKGASLNRILDDLERQSDFSFAYPQEIGKLGPYSISVKNETLLNTLQKLASGNRLSFKPIGNLISVSQLPKPPKPGRISGKILDEKGEALPGASVRILETGAGAQSGVDGNYILNVQPGTYTLEITYISFQTQRITGVVVSEDKSTSLNISMKPNARGLKEVLVTADFKKASVAGLYAQQKNAASFTDGVSAEQIARTPDNNVGAVLKRVSGITTIDNKYVVVRGLTERYNQALIDGITMPNTDLNRRNFSFDVVPVELISSVVVNKTATPDVSAEFVGGQVIVNTLSIPHQNFTSFSIGAGGNSRSTGKEFLTAGARSGSDYLGFDNGARKKPENLVFYSMANQQDDPRIETSVNGSKYGYAGAVEQGKKFKADGFNIYKYNARPNQNYRFTMGRLYDIDAQKEMKLGFVAGLTYRNSHQFDTFQSARTFGYGPDYFNSPDTVGHGNAYKFNTTLGAVLNGGIQGRRFKINVRNVYTRTFDEDFYVTYSRDIENDGSKMNTNFVDPVYTSINQHKVDAEHSIGSKGFKFDWSLGYTGLNQEHKDTRNFSYRAVPGALGTYYQSPNVSSTGTLAGNYNFDYRFWTAIKENDFNWAINLSHPFNFLKDRSLIKAGYTGWNKKRTQDISLAKIYTQRVGLNDFHQFYSTLLAPENIAYGVDQAYYFLDREGGGGVVDAYSKYHAGYLMLDQRFFNKLRLVYGLRAENFNLANRQEDEIRRRQIRQEQNPDVIYVDTAPILTGEKNWNFLPSINATYSLNEKMNVRAAYTKTMIRPDFRETSTFGFPDPILQATIRGGNISSTKIKNADLRYEFYPTPGEIISVSGFYKYLDRPVELVNLDANVGRVVLNYKNQHSAKTYGIEMELRKTLGFISPSLSNFTLFGNGALMKSEVKVYLTINNPDHTAGDGKPLQIEVIHPVKRPLMGQSPYIVNAGMGYQNKFFGSTLSFNRSGYRSYNIFGNSSLTEFQRPRSLLDLQVNARILKQKAELKLNVSNLLNTTEQYYNNSQSWIGEAGIQTKMIKGTDNYEPEHGDKMRYELTYGRSYNLSFTYNF